MRHWDLFLKLVYIIGKKKVEKIPKVISFGNIDSQLKGMMVYG